jgi:hypothetical protein
VPQALNGLWHWNPHVPALQRGVAWAGAVHALLQAPQLEVSLLVSTHEAPHAVLLPQSVLQVPPWQNMFVPHTLPQAPQFFESELRSWQAPEQLL